MQLPCIPKRSRWIVVRAFFLLFFPASAFSGTITYDIVNYPTLQNGYTVDGTITTDGNMGSLTAFDIISWSISIDGGVWPSPVTQANGTIVDLDQPVDSPGLIASPAGLELQAGGPNELFFWPNSNDQNVLNWGSWTNHGHPFADYGLELSPGHFSWDAEDQNQDALAVMAAPDNSSNLLIATPAPEPTALALLSAALLGLGVVYLRRRSAKAPL
jgi:hypothetical protein